MTLQRVDRLKEPPVIGQFYLVPTIWGRWYDTYAAWPVIGNRHEDAEFFGFSAEHFHIDYRFARVHKSWLRLVMSAPLHDSFNVPTQKPTLRRRKCLRYQHVFDGPAKIMSPFRSSFAGQQCAKGKRGWVCPHRHIALGSTPAIDGIITCPLHGLRIEAETGKVCSRVTSADHPVQGE